MSKHRNSLSSDLPKYCPSGHKHFSWSFYEKEVYCWDCNKRYPLSECFGSRRSTSPSRSFPEQPSLFSFGSEPRREMKGVYRTEKRQHLRAKVACPVVLEKNPEVFMSGRTRDISLAGAFIECWEPLKSGEPFEIEFGGAHLNDRLKVTAEVVWSNVSVPENVHEFRGMGVRFTKISDEIKRVISALVSNNPTA